jgi:hypothetical protein
MLWFRFGSESGEELNRADTDEAESQRAAEKEKGGDHRLDHSPLPHYFHCPTITHILLQLKAKRDTSLVGHRSNTIMNG